MAEQAQDAAEQVRAHLVALRGGAPFLSPVDGRLLLEWLRDEVPVAVILAELDAEAERRRRKRKRTPLRLSGIKARVRKRAAAPRPEGSGLAPLVQELERSGDAQVRALAVELGALGGEGEELVAGAMARVTRFWEKAWDRADRDALRQRARDELEDLAELMEERAFEAAVEECARDLLRQSWPQLSATRIWDTVAG